MFSLLFSLVGKVFEWVTTMAILHTLKFWASIAVTLVVACLILYASKLMIETIKSILSSKFGRWTLGLLTVASLGFGAGYLTKSPSTIEVPSKGGKSTYTELQVQKSDSKTRSTAIVKDGKIYYPGTFINKHLEKKGIPERFKEVA